MLYTAYLSCTLHSLRCHQKFSVVLQLHFKVFWELLGTGESGLTGCCNLCTMVSIQMYFSWFGVITKPSVPICNSEPKTYNGWRPVCVIGLYCNCSSCSSSTSLLSHQLVMDNYLTNNIAHSKNV